MIEALVTLNLANELGRKPATLSLAPPGRGQSPSGAPAGGGHPVPPTRREYWFYPPASFDKKLLVSDETFFNEVAPALGETDQRSYLAGRS
jgi:hypothetical protein